MYYNSPPDRKHLNVYGCLTRSRHNRESKLWDAIEIPLIISRERCCRYLVGADRMDRSGRDVEGS
jgi:hypothetical protein